MNVYIFDDTGLLTPGVDDTGRLTIPRLESWIASPILPELIEDIISHVGEMLAGTGEVGCAGKVGGTGVGVVVTDIKTLAGSPPKEKDENSCLGEIEKHEPSSAQPQKIELEQLQNKENVTVSNILSTTDSVCDDPLDCCMDEEVAEMIQELTEEFQSYRRELVEENHEVEEENSAQEEEHSLLKAELELVSDHIVNCNKERKAVAQKLKAASKSELLNLQNLKIDDQILVKETCGTDAMELKSKVSAINDCLAILTKSLQQKSLKLPMFISYSAQLGRDKFLAKYQLKQIRTLRKLRKSF